jgi:hypothetical protein
MSAPPETRIPAGRRGFGRTYNTTFNGKYTPRHPPGKAPQPPLDYYARVLGRLSINRAGWAQARCPFHQDHHASLSVRLSGNGAWKCFAGCGGGDLISFHMKRTGLSFSAALHDLVRRS